MHAIKTTYRGPTSLKPGHIIARTDSAATSVPYTYGVSEYANHHVAAEVLRKQLSWDDPRCDHLVGAW